MASQGHMVIRCAASVVGMQVDMTALVSSLWLQPSCLVVSVTYRWQMLCLTDGRHGRFRKFVGQTVCELVGDSCVNEMPTAQHLYHHIGIFCDYLFFIHYGSVRGAVDRGIRYICEWLCVRLSICPSVLFVYPSYKRKTAWAINTKVDTVI